MQMPNSQPNRSPNQRPQSTPRRAGFASSMLTGHVPIRAKDSAPPKLLFSAEDVEIEFYARSAFTAWEYALETNRAHPRLWKAIRGSPYERPYCQRFGPQD
jgi:hypothetical protein